MEVLEFESVKLFEEIIKAGQIKNLISVSSHEYPIYKFKKSNKVTSVYEKFLAEHDMKCDRSVDDCWNDFDDYINQPKKETIITRNIKAVKQIIEVGYGYMLKRTGVDKYNKRCFVFYKNPVIEDVKTKADAESKEKYNNNYLNIKKNTTDKKISGLIKSQWRKQGIMGKSFYNMNGEKLECKVESELSLSQKTGFIMEVAGMVVSPTVGYATVLRKPIFNYCLVKYYTDINIFEGDEFSLDKLEIFMKDNTELLNDIAKSIPRDEYNELEHACDEAIDYRKHNYNGYSDEISELLQVVRELVLKPDRLDEFMGSITNAVNSFANIDSMDKETLDKLINVLPVIEKATINAGSIDVNGIVKSMVKDREEKENNVVSIDDRKEE